MVAQSGSRQEAERNQAMHQVRARIEKIFGTWKLYGLRRMRWQGLAKASLRVHLTATDYNLTQATNLKAAS